MRGLAERFLKPHLVHVIPNPAPVPTLKHNEVTGRRDSRRRITAIGRLHPQKGFDLLLKAFSICAKKYPDLWVAPSFLEEGQERSFLEALILELGLKDQVNLKGIKDPILFLRETDLFVMSSRFEGFPLALVEAMACNLAVISTDCPSGPGEIIRDGINGVLVPPNNVNALASAMERLMGDPTARQCLGKHAIEVSERFGIKKIAGMWDNLLIKVCKRRTT